MASQDVRPPLKLWKTAPAILASLAFTLPAAALAAPTPPAPGVDLAKAYAPGDLALLIGILAKAGISQSLNVFAKQMGANVLTGCPAGSEDTFDREMATRLEEQRAQFRADTARGFDPPFTHDELVTLDRYYQLSPLLLAPPDMAGLPKPRVLSAAEQAEADALSKSPAVAHYIGAIGPAMTPMMEHLAALGTTTLHDVCPAKKGESIGSTGLQPETKGPDAPSP